MKISKFEKIIKREDGTQLKIAVGIYKDYSDFWYRTDLYIKPKNKRKFDNIPDTLSNWKYRELSLENREKHRWENMLNFVSQEEILQAQIECWETLKPKFPLF